MESADYIGTGSKAVPRNATYWFRQLLFPVLAITLMPPILVLIWYTHTALDGSLTALFRLFSHDGWMNTLVRIWGPVFFGSPTAWTIIGVFAGVELALMRLLPGKRFEGPITPKGNVPVYKANGMAAFSVTLALFIGCSYGLHWFSAAVVYDHFGEIIGALNIFSILFCLFLYFKGRFAPSTSDSGMSGNPIFDYYWGTELYPTIAGWNVKMFTNCRFGMMAWPLIVLSFAAKQHAVYGLSDSMLVAVALQLLYVGKFFWWETGYLRSLDIMHDRAGFYICWGCLACVPTIYTSPTLYLVNHPIHLGAWAAVILFVAGTASIFITYAADAERQRVRATGGKCTVWGKPPVTLVAPYTTEGGERKENLLLCSGFWGIARHFHYLPELAGAFLWALPALMHNVLSWFHFVFLAMILIDRAFRDDKRCAAKYGENWDLYCSKVRYKIIPGVF